MKKFISFAVALSLLCLAAPAWAVPAAPTMSYDVNGINISISWSEVPSATGYTLYYAPYPYAGLDTIDSSPMGTATSYDINLWDGAAYFIAVTASNNLGESEYSNVEYFVMTPSAPDKPVLAAEADGLNISLSWTEIPDATGYKLYYASDAAPDTFYSLDMGNKTEASYYLWEGAAYYLNVTGYNASGLESEPSNTEYFVMGPPTPEWVDNDGDGFIEIDGDCDDGDVSINPEAEEVCGDAIDQDCDGVDLICAALPEGSACSFDSQCAEGMFCKDQEDSFYGTCIVPDTQSYSYLQFRHYYNYGGRKQYRLYLPFYDEEEFNSLGDCPSIVLIDPSGAVIPPQNECPYSYDIYEEQNFFITNYDPESGFSPPQQRDNQGYVMMRYDGDLPEFIPGTYQVDINNGQFIVNIEWEGFIDLEHIAMESIVFEKNSDGSLYFQWQPISDPNCKQQALDIFDENWNTLLHVRLDPDVGQITLPKDLVDLAINDKMPTGIYWRLDTRHYTSTGMNDSRGTINSELIPWPLSY